MFSPLGVKYSHGGWWIGVDRVSLWLSSWFKSSLPWVGFGPTWTKGFRLKSIFSGSVKNFHGPGHTSTASELNDNLSIGVSAPRASAWLWLMPRGKLSLMRWLLSSKSPWTLNWDEMFKYQNSKKYEFKKVLYFWPFPMFIFSHTALY